MYMILVELTIGHMKKKNKNKNVINTHNEMGDDKNAFL